MNTKTLLLLALSSLFISCKNTSEEIEKDAESLCNCYRQVHKVSEEDMPIMQYLTDSCNTLWKNVYIKYKNNPENKSNFNQAYSECQDN